MANQSAAEHQMGSMDIREHKSTWAGFVKVTVWSCAILAVALALMAAFLV